MNLLLTLVAAVLGALFLSAVHFPAGYLVGAMVGVAIVNLTKGAVELPRAAEFVAFVGVGWLLGQAVTRDILTMVRENVVVILGVVAAMLVMGALLAFVLVRLSPFDSATAFLAASPGGLSQMAVLGAAVGANAGVVATVHVVRVVTVVLVAPLVLRMLATPG